MATDRTDRVISAPALAATARPGASLADAAALWRRLAALADAFSHWCRRVRAYHELTALDARALHEIAARPGALARLVDGEVPRGGAATGSRAPSRTLLPRDGAAPPAAPRARSGT